MTINVNRNSKSIDIQNVKNYDFYPETMILFVERYDGESIYIPINENVLSVIIEGGTERGYLEGHDEAR